MKAVNVRHLKNNPSAALRDARKHLVVVLNRDRPEALLVHLDDDALLSEPGVRRALATALYRDESLSLGQAARVARLPLAAFIEHVSRLGIPVVRGTAAGVREDAQAIATWRTGSSRRAAARRSGWPRPGIGPARKRPSRTVPTPSTSAWKSSTPESALRISPKPTCRR